MKKLLLRVILYVGMFVLFFGGVGFAGYFKSYKNFYGSVYDESFPAFEELEIPEHDPNKPTVAVMLGDGTTTTEIFDFLIPYELFAMKEAYNVYAVAPDHKVKSLFATDVSGIIEWIDGSKEPDTVQRAYFQPTRLLSLQSRLSAAYKGVMAQGQGDKKLVLLEFFT